MTSLKAKMIQTGGHIYHAILAATVKRRARSAALGARARELFALLSPLDPDGVKFERVGRDHDGGYVMVADLIQSQGVAYSLGISDDVSWDKAIAERGIIVFQYDHTIRKLPEIHQNFRFSRIGICQPGKEEKQLRSLDTLIRENGHEDRSAMILKIDIDGCEWDVLSTISEDTLMKFSQILAEFHSLQELSDRAFFEKAMATLRKLRSSFVPVHVHANNYRDLCIVGGVAIPTALEVTLIRKDLATFSACKRLFPTELDQPNNPGCADLYLGSFRF